MDASVFQYGSEFRKSQLEGILTDCILVYSNITTSGKELENNENKIRDAIAEYLSGHPKAAHVSYPHLKKDPYYDLAMKYMPEGGCGVVSFEIEGGRPAAEAFMSRLRLAAIETHVADARTCCLNWTRR